MNRLLAVLCLAIAACGPKAISDDEQKKQIATAMHDALLADILKLEAAAEALKAAAPTPAGRGWDATMDAAAIANMKARWSDARTAYEHIEGAIAPIFPDIDAAIDERYDGFLEGLGGAGDPTPFDRTGVTGMHAIERILWADATPAGVIRIESTLPGYRAAAFPATEAEAAAFKNQLAEQLVADIEVLEAQWKDANIDLDGAFTGLIDLMKEQREKVNNAANNLEESRYSQRTMHDLRDNLDGTRAIYALFEPWLKTKTDGEALAKKIRDGFDALGVVYTGVSGDAIPAPPSTWSAENPSMADLQTPFGQLYSNVRTATDPLLASSVVSTLVQAGALMRFSAGQ